MLGHTSDRCRLRGASGGPGARAISLRVRSRAYWQTKRIFDNYNDRNTFFAPGDDIAVDAVLEDYEEFTWRGITFFVLPAKGHTLGSSALLADIDGRTVAFTGDLLVAGGRLYQLHAMEYAYGDMDGVLFTLQSLQALRRRQPALILPSHGSAIEKVGDDIERLENRLIEIARLGVLEGTGLGLTQLPRAGAGSPVGASGLEWPLDVLELLRPSQRHG